jgi:tryptophanyl-tRNA synthetase
MRPTGALHLGHYHGVLKNWLALQEAYDCFFFVADWHALTTHYETPGQIAALGRDMLIDWLAVGVDPARATLFVQSMVPGHAELALLLGMMTPLGWLERVPSYKDQQAKLGDRDLSTYGFLGYPLLQSADILIYRAGLVPVGEDQVAHIELAREVARRFNHLYGREPDFEEKARAAAAKMGKQNAKRYFELRRRFQEQGDAEAVAAAGALVAGQQNVSQADRERLSGFLEGTGRTILGEPQPLLTQASRMPGIDGEKMSKSYGNTIALREEAESVRQKLRTMPTDPARVRRTDPGDPARCPVWQWHQVYSGPDTRAWAEAGCRSAGIGCLDCKQPVIEAVLTELAPIRERAQALEADREALDDLIESGAERARGIAEETLDEVRSSMGLRYR